MDIPGNRPTRVALIGLGAIGGKIVEIAARLPEEIEVVAALVTSRAREPAAMAMRHETRLPALLRARPDVVIECAGQPALREYGPAILGAGLDLVPASVGLFADDAALEIFRAASRAGGGRLRLASGAVAGVDAIMAARRLGLDTVRYRFVMSPAAWGHAAEEGDRNADASRQLVFRGNARQAASTFPKHANVTATLALAGIGFERTEVEIIVDTQAIANRHEIEASGEFGELSIVVQGRRISEGSPSSRLVAGSLFSAATGTGCATLP